MKKLFYFALMAGIAMCNISCGSDDDGTTDSSTLGNTTEGKTKEIAATFTMDEANAPMVKTPKGTAKLMETTITEYGLAVFEVEIDRAKKFCSYSVEKVADKNNVYSVKDKSNRIIGTITKEEIAASRASNEVTLQFDLSISVEVEGEMVPLMFSSTATAQQVIENVVGTFTENVTNTWRIERMKLIIDFDEKSDVSAESKGGSLIPFLELAEENDVIISEKDKEQLNRTIENVVIDKGKLFVLKYADGRSDAATWNWVNQNEGNLAIGINLKALEDGGNKFFNNRSRIAVELKSGNKINLILSTRLEEDKCTASLLVNLY